jgi:hypothetical protein
MKMKPWYLSKMILVNIVMGIAMILGAFKPEFASFIKEYFAEAGSAWALINVVLRVVSKDKITIS